MNHKVVKFVAVLAVVATCITVQPVVAQQHPVQKYWADTYGISPPAPDGKFYEWGRIAKSQPDECYFGLGNARNRASFNAIYPSDLSTGFGPQGSCSYNGVSGQPKVNQSYLWGFTSWGSDLWFGTIANTLCQAMQLFGSIPAFELNSIVCEGGMSDARPPRIFRFDTKSGQIYDMTTLIPKGGPDWAILQSTIGLRSAGSIGDIVFVAGLAGNVVGGGGVSMFAFNGRTKQYLGARLYNGQNGLPLYTNVRQWIVVEGQLYVGLATVTINGHNFVTSGNILRWTGNATNAASAFQFETVGMLGGDPAYLARYQDRVFATTWGGALDSFGTELWMSPGLSGTKKLTSATAKNWTRVWKLSDYEVEPSAGAAGGAIAAHDGWLYWSTMTPPGMQYSQFSELYPNAPSDYGFLGSYRPTELFRGKFLDDPSKKTIQVLYGNKYLPKYVEAGTTTGCTNTGPTCEWAIVPNNMGQAPKFGFAGYNNFFNSYTWWMTQYNGELFIGTFDWSYLLFESLFDLANGNPLPIGMDLGIPTISSTDANTIPPAIIDAARKFEGADLLRIHSSNDPAYVVSLNGMGNFSNYGVRNMLQVGPYLYIGTANPFNLLTDPTNTYFDEKVGGWELIRLKPTDYWYQHYTPPTTTTP